MQGTLQLFLIPTVFPDYKYYRLFTLLKGKKKHCRQRVSGLYPAPVQDTHHAGVEAAGAAHTWHAAVVVVAEAGWLRHVLNSPE